MKPAVQYSLIGVGALALFSGAYIGFAMVKGAPMHELPVFGALFPAAPEEAKSDEHGTTTETTDATPDATATNGEHGTTPEQAKTADHVASSTHTSPVEPASWGRVKALLR